MCGVTHLPDCTASDASGCCDDWVDWLSYCISALSGPATPGIEEMKSEWKLTPLRPHVLVVFSPSSLGL